VPEQEVFVGRTEVEAAGGFLDCRRVVAPLVAQPADKAMASIHPPGTPSICMELIVLR
jgi:hypothetical protein